MRASSACGVAILCLLGLGPAMAAEFPEGTFASDAEACERLAKETPAELGDDLDFQVISKKGFTAFQQVCDFVSVAPHDDTSFVATAFCDEGGYTYPDLFSIKVKGERLNVTRVTDLTANGPSSDPGMTDAPESSDGKPQDADPESAGEDAADGAEPSAADEQPLEAFSSFVKCTSVKP